MSAPTFAKLAQRNRHLFSLVDKVKLWPSRSGCLHGIRSLHLEGDQIVLETHCGATLRVHNSKHGRGKRQIKHGYYKRICKKCRIPDWKVEKFKDSALR